MVFLVKDETCSQKRNKLLSDKGRLTLSSASISKRNRSIFERNSEKMQSKQIVEIKYKFFKYSYFSTISLFVLNNLSSGISKYCSTVAVHYLQIIINKSKYIKKCS